MEGVDRPTAERLAAAAVTLGFAPRIREAVGLRYSNQRPEVAVTFAGAVFTTALISASLAVAASRGVEGGAGWVMWLAVAPVIAAWFVGQRAMYRAIELPLVVPRERVPLSAPAASLTPEGQELVRSSRVAIARLGTALLSDELPEVARDDLLETLASLRRRVDALELRAADGVDAGWAGELEELQAAAERAVLDLRADSAAPDLAAVLRRQVAALAAARRVTQ